ncbi:hypothetical protein CKO45_29010 [Paracraurococcus ruber]|uniref:Transposase DDE domain-containing protein n=1 Tax=Paracraurococcus ruber TaxID=77675 RepID=A0ABS1D5Y6_9PROT|nr:hypothetical protein [Paracraurococcus ruber]
MAARRIRAGQRARYRVRDWAAYDRALTQRGDITVWISPDAVAGWRSSAGRRTFSDAAISAALMLRAVFRLALRQAEGLIASIFRLLGTALPVPDHTTLSRRGRTLRVDRRAATRGRIDLAIDSTGLQVTRPRGAGSAGWRKLHIAVDPDTGTIMADELTRSDVHDSVPVPMLLARIDAALGRVYSDGAYAGTPTYRAVAERRQVLPNAEGVFRPKASDVRAAAAFDPLSGRGRHALRLAGDLGEVQTHGLGADMRHGQGGCGAAGGADGPEQPGGGMAIVARGRWPAAPRGPDIGQRALLADPGFVLEPDFERLAASRFGEGSRDQGSEVFLNASCAPASRCGW